MPRPIDDIRREYRDALDRAERRWRAYYRASTQADRLRVLLNRAAEDCRCADEDCQPTDKVCQSTDEIRHHPNGETQPVVVASAAAPQSAAGTGCAE